MNRRFKSKIAAYLVVKQEDKFLLSLRMNTHYMDGNYSLVAGHVEAGETPMECIIREAAEEANLQLTPESLRLAMVMYRNIPSDEYVDYFFECSNYTGILRNNEPEKCGDLTWFSPDAFPENMVYYVRDLFLHLHQYSYLEYDPQKQIIFKS